MMDVNSNVFYNLVFSINQDFYEQIYKDEWFKDVFRNISQETITQQQTDFVVQVFGGPSRYCGRMPGDAHPHIYIDEYMWNLRETYLMKSFEKCKAPEFLVEKWLKIDNSFKNKIIKKSIDDVKGRFTTDELIIVLSEQMKDKKMVA